MADDLAFLFGDGPVPPDPGPNAPHPAVKPGAQSTHPAVKPVPSSPHPAPPPPSAIEWVTLREAHEDTSIPISTLRKWAKRGKVRARLERIGDRELRFVAISDVLHRARTLGREVEPASEEVVVDLRRNERPVTAVEPASEPPPNGPSPTDAPPTQVTVAPEPVSSSAQPDAPELPEGSILVPLDAWDRLLSQLGNLHEAGQQLADARERAAKAETEAAFLRERLREMRQQLQEPERLDKPDKDKQDKDKQDKDKQDKQEEPSSDLAPTFGSDLSLQARWEQWRRRWLGRRPS